MWTAAGSEKITMRGSPARGCVPSPSQVGWSRSLPRTAARARPHPQSGRPHHRQRSARGRASCPQSWPRCHCIGMRPLRTWARARRAERREGAERRAARRVAHARVPALREHKGRKLRGRDLASTRRLSTDVTVVSNVPYGYCSETVRRRVTRAGLCFGRGSAGRSVHIAGAELGVVSERRPVALRSRARAGALPA